MPIQFSCPHCGHSMTVADQYAGTSGPCRNCQQPITIPGDRSPLPNAESPQRKSSTSIIIIIAALAVGGLLIMVMILAALLLPAVNAAREAARRNQCVNNARQIGMAIMNYESTHGTFPPAYTVDENGQPLHSWRVLILPYLEHAGLYDQLDLSKPWDDPVNAALLQSMPDVYRCPSGPDDSTNTSYVVVVGPDTAFPGSDTRAPADIDDGLSNTVLVLETNQDIHWAEPRDLSQDQVVSGAGSSHPGNVAIIVHADAAVNVLPIANAAELLPAMVTIKGGEVINY